MLKTDNSKEGDILTIYNGVSLYTINLVKSQKCNNINKWDIILTKVIVNSNI